MDFSSLFRRANLNSVEEYLLNGGESLLKPSNKTYSERLTEAQKNISAFFETQFKDPNRLEQAFLYYDEQVQAYHDVFLKLA